MGYLATKRSKYLNSRVFPLRPELENPGIESTAFQTLTAVQSVDGPAFGHGVANGTPAACGLPKSSTSQYACKVKVHATVMFR